MSLVATEAVVLHVFDYLESSRIVRLLTREMGLQSVVARGARQSRTRFGSSLDSFASGTAHFSVRPGRELFNLTGFDVTHSRFDIAGDLDRFRAASAVAELALRFSHAQANDEAFDVLVRAFDAIERAAPGTATDTGLAAAWRFVAALGFSPAVDICCSCHADVADSDATPFSHGGGGVLCPDCAARGPVSRALPRSAREALRAWFRGGEATLASDAERRAHLRLLREFLHQHVSDNTTLRALEAWEAGQRRSA